MPYGHIANLNKPAAENEVCCSCTSVTRTNKVTSRRFGTRLYDKWKGATSEAEQAALQASLGYAPRGPAAAPAEEAPAEAPADEAAPEEAPPE